MKKNASYPIVMSGLMVALGLALPYFTAHAFGIPGTILLPMHLPVLLCGLLCGPRLGALCGLVVPVLSSLLTGMPPAYPMLPIMAAQLIVCGLIGGLSYRTYRMPLMLSLLLAMVGGWAVYGLTFSLLLLAGGGTIKALSVTAALVKGAPGIAAQLVLVPVLLKAAELAQSRRSAASNDNASLSAQPQWLNQARALIKKGEASCVVLKDGAIIHTADGRGVSPLLNLYQEQPQMLEQAVVVDKIIGKAAAVILILAGAKEVYGEVMSVSAREYLTQHGIAASYTRCVDVINARSGNGICPIEKSVLDIVDPQQGLEALLKQLQQMRSAG